MTNRDAILNKLRSKTRPRDATYTEIWSSRRQYSDLADQFTQALTAVSGQVHHANSWAEAITTLEQLLVQLDAKHVVRNNVAPLRDVALPHLDLIWHTAGDKKDATALRDFCTTADVGVSQCEAALAETGTVLVASGSGKGRLVTLLPPIHIALVPTSKLTTDLFTWTASRNHDPLPAHLAAVSGPSKTADIEQTMAIGVHGPKQFIVVLYED